MSRPRFVRWPSATAPSAALEWLRRRLRSSGETGAAARPPPAWTGPPSARPLEPVAEDRLRRAMLFAIVVGLEGEELETVVDAASAVALETGVRVVFVTDALQFAPFRRRKALFEHLPDPGALGPRRDRARVHRDRKVGLLLGKWRPVKVVAYGARASALLAELAVSPHLSEEARAALKGE